MSVELEALLAQVEAEGQKRFATIYDLCHRNAGWGVMWHEATRELPPVGNDNNAWRTGLIVYGYKPTLREALEAELQRMNPSPAPPKEQHMAQQPGIGRVVHYQGPGNNIPAGQPGHFPPTPYPATIVAVNPDGTVALFVMTKVGHMNLDGISTGGPDGTQPTPGCWNWPPFVPAK